MRRHRQLAVAALLALAVCVVAGALDPPPDAAHSHIGPPSGVLDQQLDALLRFKRHIDPSGQGLSWWVPPGGHNRAPGRGGGSPGAAAEAAAEAANHPYARWHKLPPGGRPFCAWRGVRCDAAGQAVLAIELRASWWQGDRIRLPHGTLPPAAVLAGLPHLRALRISGHSGPMCPWHDTCPEHSRPLWVHRMGWEIPAHTGATHRPPGTQLISVRGGVHGTLPADWASLRHLEVLELSGNNLVATVPAAWASNLTSVRVLDLRGNHLHGTLPEFGGGMAALERLELDGNYFTGTLPASLGRLSSLVHLSVDGAEEDPRMHACDDAARRRATRVNGTLPAAWAQQLPRLRVLRLAGQALGGSLPAEWSALAELQHLDLSRNQLSGSLPAAWQGRLDAAHASATCPHDWPGGSGMAALEELRLGGNMLEGDLPAWGAGRHGLKRLRVLDVSRNRIASTLPGSWRLLGKLEDLNVEFNAAPDGTGGLSGTIPRGWGELRSLRDLGLRGNPSLRGCLPASLWRHGRLWEPRDLWEQPPDFEPAPPDPDWLGWVVSGTALEGVCCEAGGCECACSSLTKPRTLVCTRRGACFDTACAACVWATHGSGVALPAWAVTRAEPVAAA